MIWNIDELIYQLSECKSMFSKLVTTEMKDSVHLVSFNQRPPEGKSQNMRWKQINWIHGEYEYSPS